MQWIARRSSRVVVSTAIVAVGVAAPALAASLPRNSVGAKQIEPRAVRSAELAPAAVRRVHIDANAVDGTTVLDEALSGFDIADDSLTGADVDEMSLDLTVLQARLGGCEAGKAIRAVSAAGRPTCVAVSASGAVGALGGDLTGTLPNPSIAVNAVTSGKVLNDTLTGADIDEASLAGVPSALDADQLDGLDSADFLQSGDLSGYLQDTDTAGGDLGGTFSNLDLVADAVTSGEVVNNTLTGADIDESSLAEVPSAADATNAVDALTAGFADDAGELDGLDSTDFLDAAATAGGDLGGTFANLDLVANAVDSTELGSSGSIDTDRAVTTNAIRDDAVTAAKVPLNELGGSDILESSLGTVPSATAADTATSATTATTATSATTAGFADDADLLDGVDYSSVDSRLDALCAQADTINQEVRDLRTALDIPTLTGIGIGLDLSGVNLPDFDPAPCQA